MSNKQIIIIPGILGSELRYGSYKLWPPHNSALWKLANIIKIIDYLGDLENSNISARKCWKKYYQDLIDYLTNLDIDATVTVFPYDWRKNNIKQIDELAQKIDRNADEIIVVAHSMGGIVSKLFLTSDKYPELSSKVSKLITMGTPWNGSAEAYSKLRFGAGINGIRERVKPLIERYESVYQLLPNNEYVEEHKKNFGRGYLNGKSWNDIYNKNYIPMIEGNGLNHEEILKKFYEYMSRDLPEWVEHHEIIGYDKGTLSGIYDKGSKANGVHGNGDGTVPLHSAISNTMYNYFVKSEHKAITSDREVLTILSMILKDDKSFEDIKSELNLPSKEEVLNEDFEIKVVKIACPVSVSMVDEDGEIIYGDLGETQGDSLLELLLNGSENVNYIDGDVYFIIDEDKDINKLQVAAYDEGAVSISVNKYTNQGLSSSTKFRTFNINNFKNVDITIDNNEDEYNVELIKDEHNEVNKIESVTVGEEGTEVSLPKTVYKLTGQQISNINSNNYLASGEIYLHIQDVNKGSYSVEGTFYSINGGNNILIEKTISTLKLKDGINKIKVYSTDIYDNIEEVEEQIIYYIQDSIKRIPKIIINANPDSYTLSTEFKEYEGLSKLQLPNPLCRFIFEEGEELVDSYVENKNIIRTVHLEVEDALGKTRSDSFKINEPLLNLILRSNGSVDDCKVFLSSLGINASDMHRYKFISGNKIINYKNIEKSRIIDADKLIFKNNFIEIEIDKMRNFEVMFSNLIEYIKLDEDTENKFEFSVFKDKAKKYSGDDISISMAIESDTVGYNEVKKIEYKIEDEKYKFSIKSDEIISLSKEHDVSNKIFILIKIKDDKDTVLRVCEINLK